MNTTDTPRTDTYYAGKGCECSAHNRSECGCDVDWTDPRIYELQAEVEFWKSKAYEAEHREGKLEAEITRLKALFYYHHESYCRKCGSKEMTDTTKGNVSDS